MSYTTVLKKTKVKCYFYYVYLIDFHAWRRVPFLVYCLARTAIMINKFKKEEEDFSKDVLPGDSHIWIFIVSQEQ